MSKHVVPVVLWRIIVGVVVLAVLSGLAYWASVSILGSQMSGTCDDLSDVPVFGKHLHGFDTRGSNHYYIFQYRGGESVNGVIAGHTTLEEITLLSRQLGVAQTPGGGEMLNGMIRHYASVDGAGFVGQNEFDRNDVLIHGNATHFGRIEGAFRRSDGYFIVIFSKSGVPREFSD